MAEVNEARSAKYRASLPQLDGNLFLTDGGIETTLIFHDGLDLPYFAAFDLMNKREGRDALRRYFTRHAGIARDNGVGFIFESPTWRASADWGSKLGYSEAAIAQVNKDSVTFLAALRDEMETAAAPMVISGCVGPRGDGYDPGDMMTAMEAEAYHRKQIAAFAGSEADMVTAITMTYVDEAVGLTRAAKAEGMPVAISFTVETDGRLPSGQSLREAIKAVDTATDAGPAYFMINCAHPTHFESSVKAGEAWVKRIKGLRANASRLSHAELDEAEELDDGNPSELGQQYRSLRGLLTQVTVLGGCCGTDHRHIEAICHACSSEQAA
ncbi:homocysteine S-methyltransferase [Pelagibius litoralis]|uniref:Homocysteine S-methyltransferase n=1 Tax=Pelagibius litoralis TaxID=374515 RepID=A0A967F082_9PROT|nr:homocysteine S-methyltransferase family protein [Pelagibius litoralis]NIA70628.1 homocysteine S-methyltransferase [Pelagibius litoralis]